MVCCQSAAALSGMAHMAQVGLVNNGNTACVCSWSSCHQRVHELLYPYIHLLDGALRYCNQCSPARASAAELVDMEMMHATDLQYSCLSNFSLL